MVKKQIIKSLQNNCQPVTNKIENKLPLHQTYNLHANNKKEMLCGISKGKIAVGGT